MSGRDSGPSAEVLDARSRPTGADHRTLTLSRLVTVPATYRGRPTSGVLASGA